MSGVYDPNSKDPGRVRWEKQPEKLDLPLDADFAKRAHGTSKIPLVEEVLF